LLLFIVPRYDIVHIFSASYYSYLFCAVPPILIAKLFGKRSILNYRSGEAEDHLQNWRLTARPIMRLADVIVVPSGYLVELFGRFDLPARAIYNLVELDRFSYRERRPLKPIFLTSRLLEPLYNVGCVLKPFALIQKEYPEAELTVAADGWMRAELEQLAVDLNLKATRFIGRVPFDQMPAMYDAAEIYLTATNLDNMPASITECMACGVPVVTTDAGGIPYIVKHEESCLMIARDDHVAMAESAIRLLRDNDLAVRLTERARADSVKFTWNAVRAEWIKLYQELVPDRVTQTATETPSHPQPSESSAQF
jgi:glycosyltransferase involved in cell wall biosynthesis